MSTRRVNSNVIKGRLVAQNVRPGDSVWAFLRAR